MLHVAIPSFSYEDEITLHNLTFTLNEGQQLAIIGESGSGIWLDVLSQGRDAGY